MGEVDVPFLGFTFVAHYIDFVTRLELGLAFVIQHFSQRQHAFGLRADVHDDVGRSKLQDGAFENIVLARGFFCFGGESLQG